MPSATFPRNDKWKPTTVTKMTLPASRRQITKAGIVQTRGSTTVGFTWSETYLPLRARDADVEAFLSYVDWAWNTGAEFAIQHLMKPGSGVAPNGTGTGGITVSGVDQVGDTLTTAGWPISTNNVSRAGDLISIAGIQRVFQVVEDANSNGSGIADLVINPSIYSGGSPSNGAAVTTTGVEINAIVMEVSQTSISNAFYYDGMSITFREAP